MDFHENISKLKIWAMGTVLVSLLAAILAWVIMDNQWAGLLAGLFALALAVYVIPLKKTSRSGRTFQANWLKYRDELLTKLSDEQNKLPLNKWEEELIYAVPLGTAEEILNELPQMYNESEFEDGNLTILYKDNVPWLSHMLESTK
jgi:Ca2+/Na+ antiporter